MMRWLDALGAFKWPSLLLVASPLVAYPSWVPRPELGEWCETVSVDGRRFEVYRRPGTGDFVLRPSSSIGAARKLEVRESIFDAGGMVVAPGALDAQAYLCASPRARSPV
jgi:hypothetical protein